MDYIETVKKRGIKDILANSALWYGGKILYALYRSKLPFISSQARKWLAGRSYSRDLVPMQELEEAYGAALDWLIEAKGGEVSGAYLEYGVCTGSSMIALNKALQHRDNVDLKFIGFDSFDGLPDNAGAQDNGVWKAGSFMSEKSRTEARLKDNGVTPYLVEGWFSHTLNEETRRKYEIQSAPLIMVDCDIYSAAKESLEFSITHITGPTVILFDDWHSCGLDEINQGEARAWQEVLEANPDIKEIGQLKPYNENSHIIMVDRA
ncbi:MAG: TylF/MycF/NovP-related O-methyltransferase [Cyanobacteria bacterium P01_D01_bin.6]